MYILPIYGYIGRAYTSYCCTFPAVYAVRHYLLFIDMFSIVLGLGQSLDVQPLNRHRHIPSNTLTHTQKYMQALTQTYTYTHTNIHTKTHSHGGSTVASLSTWCWQRRRSPKAEKGERGEKRGTEAMEKRRQGGRSRVTARFRWHCRSFRLTESVAQFGDI